MIRIDDLNDRHGRRTLSVVETPEDKQSSWNISLISSDLPLDFQKASQRSVNCSIVDQSDINGDDTNVMYLPIIQSAMSFHDGQVKLYFKHTSSSETTLAPELTLDCFIMTSVDQAKSFRTPWLRMEFKVQTQDNQNSQSMDPNSQQFSGTSQNNDQIRQHVDKNENANGGLDLPVGEQKSDQQEQTRKQEHPGYADA